VSVHEQPATCHHTHAAPILTIHRRAGKTGEDPLDDIICADFKKRHTFKKTVRKALAVIRSGNGLPLGRKSCRMHAVRKQPSDQIVLGYRWKCHVPDLRSNEHASHACDPIHG
jgi:hypothetical protein